MANDDPKNLKLVRDTLQVKGYQTIEAETGEEGVQLAANDEGRTRIIVAQPSISSTVRQISIADGHDHSYALDGSRPLRRLCCPGRPSR